MNRDKRSGTFEDGSQGVRESAPYTVVTMLVSYIEDHRVGG